MIWHIILLALSPLAALVGRLTPDDRDREILALRQQVLILQRQLGKRPRLLGSERLSLLLTCLRMKKQQLLSALLIVKPETVIGWHRQIVRRHWTFKQKRKPGRPPIDPQAEQLIIQIARENLRWGYTKIAGEVRKLGYPTIGRSTVERTLKRRGLAPRPHHGGLSWADFLGHYGRFIWACDFFTVTTATLRTYYVLFFIEISTRRIVYWNISQHPDGGWVAQQFRNLEVIHGDLPRYLIHDRDSKFTVHADVLLQAMGTKPVLLPVTRPQWSRRTLDPFSAQPVPGPHHHPERTAPPLGPPRVRPVLQRSASASIAATHPAERSRRQHSRREGRPAQAPRRSHQRLLPGGCLTKPPPSPSETGLHPRPPLRCLARVKLWSRTPNWIVRWVRLSAIHVR